MTSATAAAWAQALFTGMAFLATYLLLRHEVGIRNADELRRTRAQAESVRWEVAELNPETGDFTIEVVNGSTGHLTDLAMVSLRAVAGPREVLDTATSWQLSPGERCIVVFHTGGPMAPDGDGNQVRRPPVEVAFTDGAGLRWLLDATGRLVEVRSGH